MNTKIICRPLKIGTKNVYVNNVNIWSIQKCDTELFKIVDIIFKFYLFLKPYDKSNISTKPLFCPTYNSWYFLSKANPCEQFVVIIDDSIWLWCWLLTEIMCTASLCESLRKMFCLSSYTIALMWLRIIEGTLTLFHV